MLRAQQRENAQLSQQVQAQRDRNDTLKDAVATLNAAGVDGQAALERAARNELGFVRTDEILLTGLPVAAVRSDVSADAPADASAAPVAAVSPPPKK